MINRCTMGGVVKNQPSINVSVDCFYDPNQKRQRYILKVFRHYDDLPNEFGGRGVIKYLDHYNKEFSSHEEAIEFAMNHGYLQVYRPQYNPKQKQYRRDMFWKYHAPKLGLTPL